MDKLAVRFGQSVRVRRRAIGITQAGLAERTGHSEEWIRRIERGVGSPSFEALDALAEALGAPVSELFEVSATSPRDRLYAVLAGLSDADFGWVEEIVQAALKTPRD